MLHSLQYYCICHSMSTEPPEFRCFSYRGRAPCPGAADTGDSPRGCRVTRVLRAQERRRDIGRGMRLCRRFGHKATTAVSVETRNRPIGMRRAPVLPSTAQKLHPVPVRDDREGGGPRVQDHSWPGSAGLHAAPEKGIELWCKREIEGRAVCSHERTQPAWQIASSGIPTPQTFEGAHYQRITWPPSTLMLWAVTWAAREEERKATMPATSSGVCQRASGATVRTFSPAQSS